MSRSSMIPPGSWPAQMCAELAAGYCGEPTVEIFRRRRSRRKLHNIFQFNPEDRLR